MAKADREVEDLAVGVVAASEVVAEEASARGKVFVFHHVKPFNDLLQLQY